MLARITYWSKIYWL